MAAARAALDRPYRAAPPARPALLRRAGGGGGVGGPDGECAACQTGNWAVAPPIVHDVLRSPGRPLDATTRALMERRFGHDFGRVRVHDGAAAAASARAVNAAAYAVGSDVVFAAGRYAPGDAGGRRLLAHELAHTLQPSPPGAGRPGPAGPIPVASPHDPAEAEAEADRAADAVALPPGPAGPAAGAGRVLRRQPAGGTPAPPAPAGAMTRAEFVHVMSTRFGVGRVRTGTFDEQVKELTPNGGWPGGVPGLSPATWKSWDPGDPSPAYDAIVSGFEDFEAAVGSYPRVTEIVFYDTDYDVTPAGVAVPRPDAGASFGAGHLTVYRAATLLAHRPALPTGRSTTAAPVPGRGPTVAVSGRGSTPGAPLPLPTAREGMARVITHELGHGLAEAVLTPADPRVAARTPWRVSQPDPKMMADYRAAAGWTAADPAELFDAGASPVGAAVAAGLPPPAAFRITQDNWNNPRWVEQPISGYMTTAPYEDFAEAVMAYVNDPDLLEARSPRRYAFLAAGLPEWRGLLVVRPPPRPPVGDFPEPTSDERAA